MNVSPNLHPIVAAMQPSPEQAPAITARGRDVVVTAGAGAGKTLTLVARYLALLAEEVPLRHRHHLHRESRPRDAQPRARRGPPLPGSPSA